MTMGETIKKLRLQKGLTLEEVGQYIGVQKSAVKKYENGVVENIPRNSIIKMAELFGVTPCYLMGFENKEVTESTVENKYSPIDEQEKTLLKLFRGTTEEGRMRIIQAVLNICDEVEITALNGKNYNSAG